MNFSTIAILGPGLLGGSLALAARERLPGAATRVWARREESATQVRALGISASTDLAATVAGADLIVFCTPIGSMAALARQIRDSISPGAVVTDVGSVKQPVAETLGAIFRGAATFIGSHPMAGSEQTGLEAARADLFQDAVSIVAPEPGTPPAMVRALTNFWEQLGCRCVPISNAAAHDEAVALVSHLPHLVAATLVQTALRENPAALDWCGNGFRDTTRVASGPPAMWGEILEQNRGPVKKAVHAMIENLLEVTKLLDAGDPGAVEQFLAEAKSARDRLKQKTIS